MQRSNICFVGEQGPVKFKFDVHFHNRFTPSHLPKNHELDVFVQGESSNLEPREVKAGIKSHLASPNC